MISPRKKSSTKKTNIPPELLEQIEDLLLTNFKKDLRRRIPVVTGYIYPEEILIGVGLTLPQRLKQPRFDVSVDYDSKKDNATKMIHLCVDLLAGLFEKLVNEEDDADFPRIWQEFDFENRTVFVQYGTTNLDLENEANRLLGEESEGLVQFDKEDEAYETSESIKSRLGFSEDDDEEDPAH